MAEDLPGGREDPLLLGLEEFRVAINPAGQAEIFLARGSIEGVSPIVQ